MMAASAADFLPDRRSLPALEEAAHDCRGCELYKNATQTVFGEGPIDADAFFVGEQPGNDEDLRGRPFVGPAGRLLDEALVAAGIDRSRVYVTNAVKHFKSIQRGKRRLHQKPRTREMMACRPWLLAEIEAVKPGVIVLLGATAAHSLMGRHFRVTATRGAIIASPYGRVLPTVHPSSILRAPDRDERHRQKELFFADMKKLRSVIDRRAVA